MNKFILRQINNIPFFVPFAESRVAVVGAPLIESTPTMFTFELHLDFPFSLNLKHARQYGFMRHATPGCEHLPRAKGS
jgi:hypothetical protein